MRPLTNEDKAKLMKIRALLDKYMPYILENPTEINYAAECMYDWAPAAYVVGDVRKYNGIPYKCVQAHTSQIDWSPDKTPALWAKAGDPAVEYSEWSQPVGAHDAYMTGDKVSHSNKHWISIVDNNVWEPGVYGWNEVAE